MTYHTVEDISLDLETPFRYGSKYIHKENYGPYQLPISSLAAVWMVYHFNSQYDAIMLDSVQREFRTDILILVWNQVVSHMMAYICRNLSQCVPENPRKNQKWICQNFLLSLISWSRIRRIIQEHLWNSVSCGFYFSAICYCLRVSYSVLHHCSEMQKCSEKFIFWMCSLHFVNVLYLQLSCVGVTEHCKSNSILNWKEKQECTVFLWIYSGQDWLIRTGLNVINFEMLPATNCADLRKYWW